MPTILSPIGVDQMANHNFFFHDLDKRMSTMVGAKKLERLEVRLDGCCRGRDVGGPLPKSCALGSHFAYKQLTLFLTLTNLILTPPGHGGVVSLPFSLNSTNANS